MPRYVTALLVLLLAAPGLADTYVIEAEGLPPTFISDANAYLAGLRQLLDLAPPGPGAQAAIVIPAAPAAPAAALPADAPALVAASEDPGRTPGLPVDLMDVTDPVPGPPTAEFRQVLSSIYFVTAPAEVEAIWGWFSKEPPDGLGLNERVGNAVMKYVVATDQPLPEDPSAQPAGLKPDATRGTVRSPNGVVMRRLPWGPATGAAALPLGAAVTVIPPADGCWYQVQSAQGTGWVCGLWLDLQ